MILIISDPEDAHARYVHRRLLELGADSRIFDLALVPSRSSLSSWIDPTRGPRSVIRLEPPSPPIDLERVKTVWFRRVNPLVADESLAPEDQEFAKSESICFLVSLAVLLGDRFWVNPLTDGLAAEGGHGKIAHLELARQLGLRVPRTLATNDPDEARAFLKTLGGEAIYKPFRSPIRKLTLEDGGEAYAGIFTNKLDDEALEQLDGVRHAPCIFQELVPKKVELRVAVMGDKVFACAIHSQTDERSSVDFRRQQLLGKTPHSPHELPAEVAAKLVELNLRLGLVYGGFDLILTPEGSYVFLEVNQQGQFLWLEEQAGLPLLENFCAMLIQARKDFVCDAKPHEPGPFPAFPEES